MRIRERKIRWEGDGMRLPVYPPGIGEPANDGEPREVDPAALPDMEPWEMARDLVADIDDMAIDIIEAQIKYWTKTLEEAKQQLKPTH